MVVVNTVAKIEGQNPCRVGEEEHRSVIGSNGVCIPPYHRMVISEENIDMGGHVDKMTSIGETVSTWSERVRKIA